MVFNKEETTKEDNMNGQMCLLEKTFRKLGFVLTHDGQRNPGQFKLPPEEVRCFIRKYRLKIDGQWVHTWVVFKYDERSQFADFEITSREPDAWGKQKILLETEQVDDSVSTVQNNTK